MGCPESEMITTRHRGLLPFLFAVFALVLIAYPVNAADHADAMAHSTAHTDISADHEAQHPLHATGCCTLACGIVFAGFNLALERRSAPSFAIATADIPVISRFRSKHFRPPRLA